MHRAWGLAVLLGLPVGIPLHAQELDPRAMQNAPVGLSFVVVAAGYSRGNLLFEPTLPIEDATADVWSAAVGFAHTIDVFGMNGRVGVAVPLVTGDWRGSLAGVDTSTGRTGMADPRVTFALNFVGAPALTLTEMRGYQQTTVAGMQVAVGLPLGQYYPERLINLGANRWSVASRLGVSHTFARRWVVEAYAGAAFFSPNGDFYGGGRFTQAPFFEVQAHGIYALRVPDTWVAVSAGYGWGGAATVNGATGDRLENVRASAMLRLPLARRHGLKLVYITGITTRLGADFDTFQVAYQYSFGGRR